MQRKIIHCDCDCFFAAVEMRDDPTLADIPIAVGGSADRRGVISTCNYAARAFGVRSAMPTARALKLCPSLRVLPGRMEQYRQVSRQIMAIYRDYTDRTEPLSLDEAYLDVTGSEHCRGSATRIAEEIRARVRAEVGITVSAGVAPSKFLAKIASDWRKPDGLFVILPQEVEPFVAALEVEKLNGVGAKTAERLHKLGIRTCADLRNFSLAQLVDQFIRFGKRLYELSRGIDNRPVEVNHTRRSISVETTFSTDLPDLPSCTVQLPALLDDLARRFERHRERYSVTGAVVKIKFADFTQTTAEAAADAPDQAHFQALMKEAFERGSKPVRLLGVGYRLGAYQPPQGVQLSLL